MYCTWTFSGSTEVMCGVSASGWMEKQHFLQLVCKRLIPVLKKMKLIAANDESDYRDDNSSSVILFSMATIHTLT